MHLRPDGVTEQIWPYQRISQLLHSKLDSDQKNRYLEGYSEHKMTWECFETATRSDRPSDSPFAIIAFALGIGFRQRQWPHSSLARPHNKKLKGLASLGRPSDQPNPNLDHRSQQHPLQSVRPATTTEKKLHWRR